jgi:hypothetical protein
MVGLLLLASVGIELERSLPAFGGCGEEDRRALSFLVGSKE